MLYRRSDAVRTSRHVAGSTALGSVSPLVTNIHCACAFDAQERRKALYLRVFAHAPASGVDMGAQLRNVCKG